ncbi:MAG: MarR family transcriptional regulator [Acidimicrobiales bacterium]
MSEPIEDEPLMGALLRMPVDAIRQRMLDDLHAAGFTDVVPAHSAVFRYPGPQGRRPSDVAAEAGMSRQAMNYLLGELEQLGYLVRRSDPGDKRSRRIVLTKRGYAVQRILRESVRGIEADLERELGHDELVQLRQLLVVLNGSRFVRDYREKTGQPPVAAEVNG